MYRPFAYNCTVSAVYDVVDILDSDSPEFKNSSWRCFISSSNPISGFFEFKYFLDFFDFISMLHFRYPDIILNIYFKSSKL